MIKNNIFLMKMIFIQWRIQLDKNLNGNSGMSFQYRLKKKKKSYKLEFETRRRDVSRYMCSLWLLGDFLVLGRCGMQNCRSNNLCTDRPQHALLDQPRLAKSSPHGPQRTSATATSSHHARALFASVITKPKTASRNGVHRL